MIVSTTCNNISAKDDDSIIINEYNELIKSLDLEYDKIRTIEYNNIVSEYKQHIYDIKSLYSTKQLEMFGYNEDQIYAITHYDGSEEMTSRASATVTATPGKDVLTYDSSTNLTRAKLSVTFTINGILGYYYRNYAALSMAASNGNPFQPVYTSTSFGQITYKIIDDSGNVSGYTYKSATKDGDDGVDGAYKFSFETRPETNYLIHFAKFSIDSKVEGKPSFITFRYAYGYATLNIGIGVGLTIEGDSVSGTITFDPKIAVTLLPSSDDNKKKFIMFRWS